MENTIHKLPDNVANQIAAGEVVQRPASLVKELLENAVDAGSTHIRMIVREAGKNLVQVLDDGCGMSEADAKLCFERHATSKIRSAEDLFALHTKGFRGEALASIAAVAQVELTTRRREDELGTKILNEGSSITSVEPLVCGAGTSIAVKNLFYNIPVRRNFLKTNQYELRLIIDEFLRVALAHTDVAFELVHNESPVYSLKASSLRERIVKIFGNNTDGKLIPVDEQTDIVNVQGFVYKPEFAKKKGGEQFFFVNDRFVKSTYLNHAVRSAFEGLIPSDSYPVYFLFITLDPARIDVNIHPTKTEINFDDPQTVYTFLRAALKHALGQYSVATDIDFDTDSSINKILDNPSRNVSIPPILVDPSFNPFKEESFMRDTTGKTSLQGTTGRDFPQDRDWKTSLRDTGSRGNSYRAGGFKNESTTGWEALYAGLKDEQKDETEPSSDLFSSSDTQSDSGVVAGRGEKKYFQLHNRYILSHIKSGFILIDPHRAHWRILYEKYLAQATGNSGVSQQMLFPVTVQTTAQEHMLLQEIEPYLRSLGFQIEASQGSADITGVPVGVQAGEVQHIIEKILEDYANENPLKNEAAQSTARSLSLSLSVNNGMPLSQQEMSNIVNELFLCDLPETAPNGKPTYVRMGLEEFEKKFN